MAYLLSERSEEAEKICLELTEENPYNVQALSTLAAVYTEQGRTKESRELALRLIEFKDVTPDEIYKIATVCCENNLHRQALEKFCELEKIIPYDGNMLYFKGVAAYKSGDTPLAIDTMEKLCTIYPTRRWRNTISKRCAVTKTIPNLCPSRSPLTFIACRRTREPIAAGR